MIRIKANRRKVFAFPATDCNKCGWWIGGEIETYLCLPHSDAAAAAPAAALMPQPLLVRPLLADQIRHLSTSDLLLLFWWRHKMCIGLISLLLIFFHLSSSALRRGFLCLLPDTGWKHRWWNESGSIPIIPSSYWVMYWRKESWEILLVTTYGVGTRAAEHQGCNWLQPRAVCSHTFNGFIWHRAIEMNSIQLHDSSVMVPLESFQFTFTFTWHPSIQSSVYPIKILYYVAYI